MTDLDDYYSGGYFLIKAGKPEWEQLKHELLPEKLVSLSDCICPHLSVYWGWTPGDREAALHFGIPDTKLDAFVAWCGSEYQAQMAYTSMFHSTDGARRFVAYFLPEVANLYLIGVGLHHELETARWGIPDTQETHGVTARISQHLPLEVDGTMLGFEVVSYAYHDFGHSWLCGGLEREMHDLYGIRPNPYGLIDTFTDAKKVHDWIAEDNLQGTRAEPEPYAPWLLVSYPL